MALWGPLLIQIIKLWSTDCIKMLVYWWLKIAKICFPLYTSWFYHCKSNVHLQTCKTQTCGGEKKIMSIPLMEDNCFLNFDTINKTKKHFTQRSVMCQTMPLIIYDSSVNYLQNQIGNSLNQKSSFLIAELNYMDSH